MENVYSATKSLAKGFWTQIKRHQKILYKIACPLVAFVGIFLFSLIVDFYPLEISLLASLALGALAYKRPELAIIGGLLFSTPSYFYQGAVLGCFGVLLVIVIMYATHEDWRLGLMAILVTSFCFQPILAPVAGALVIIGGIYFGSKFGVSLGLLSVAVTSFFMIGMNRNMAGIIIIPSIDNSGHALQPRLALNQFFPANIANSLVTNFNMNVFSDEIAKIAPVFFREGSLLIYLNIAFWTVAGFASGKTIDRAGVVSWRWSVLASALCSGLVIVPFAYASSSILSLNVQAGLIAAVLLSAILIAPLFSPFLNPFDRFLDPERKTLVKATQFITKMDNRSLGSFDIGGYEAVKKELDEAIIWPLERRDIVEKYKINPPSGVVLIGPPDCGKMKLVLGMRKQTEAPYLLVRCAEINDAGSIDRIFEVGIRMKRCLMIFSDVNTLFDRGGQSQATSDIINSFLKGLDQVSLMPEIVPIGVSSASSVLQREVLAPGRFEKVVYLHLPTEEDRSSIFRTYLKDRPVAAGVDYEQLSQKTPYFTDLEIEIACQDASIAAAKRIKVAGEYEPITMQDLLTAIDKITPRHDGRTSELYSRTYEKMKENVERLRVRAKLREILVAD